MSIIARFRWWWGLLFLGAGLLLLASFYFDARRAGLDDRNTRTPA